MMSSTHTRRLDFLLPSLPTLHVSHGCVWRDPNFQNFPNFPFVTVLVKFFSAPIFQISQPFCPSMKSVLHNIWSLHHSVLDPFQFFLLPPTSANFPSFRPPITTLPTTFWSIHDTVLHDCASVTKPSREMCLEPFLPHCFWGPHERKPLLNSPRPLRTQGRV